MVCLGNICRSPLAHGILEKMAAEAGLDWQIDSAGTGDWHIGSPPDHRSIAVAQRYGIDISEQTCRRFSRHDFERYDKIYVMDGQNLRDVLALARNDKDESKVELFLGHKDVPDPYRDDLLFEPVYKMIEKRCREIIAMHRQQIT